MSDKRAIIEGYGDDLNPRTVPGFLRDLDAYAAEVRAAALREAAAFLADERERFADFSFLGKLNAGFRNGLRYGSDEIRRMATEEFGDYASASVVLGILDGEINIEEENEPL